MKDVESRTRIPKMSYNNWSYRCSTPSQEHLSEKLSRFSFPLHKRQQRIDTPASPDACAVVNGRESYIRIKYEITKI